MMKLLGEEAGQALRHRPVQALALAALAFAATVMATLAPLYSTDMANAVTRQDIAHATPMTTALQLSSQAGRDQYTGDVHNAVEPSGLAALVPASLRRHYADPVLTRSAHADNAPYRLTGQIVWRSGACEHVTVVSGRCPTKPREIMVSQPDLHLHRVRLGGHVPISGVTVENGSPPSILLHIVGVYRIEPGGFWSVDDPVGKSGSPAGTGTGHDDWFSAESTFLDGARPLPGAASSAVLPIDPDAVDVTTFLSLPGRITALSEQIRDKTSGAVTVGSTVGTLSEDVRTQRAQAARTVPLLMLQVVLLTLVVFWQVLGAAADQRRPDVALARLRGRSRRATTRSLLRELLPVVEAGVLLGGLGGIGASLLARATLIPASSFVLPATFWAALAAAAAVVAALTFLTARNLAHEPVDRLLRQVPARHRWRWTALDTVLLTLAAAGTAAFVLGGLGRDFALAGPALVALLAGLLLGHVVTPLAATWGRRSLARGHVVRGLAALEAARRPGARRTVTLVTLAAAFLVFFANAWAVGADNRQSVAEQVVGAPRVLTVSTDAIAPLRAALAEADPRGERATPVVRVLPLGDGSAPSTMAVDPAHFSQVALLSDAARATPWDHLIPTTGPRVRISGHSLSLTADTSGLPGFAGPVELTLQLLRPDGQHVTTVSLGTLRHGQGTRTLRAPIPCTPACTMLTLALGATPGTEWTGTIRLGAIRTDGDGSWGGPAGWTPWSGTAGAHLTPSASGTDGLLLDVSSGGNGTLTLTSSWLVTTLPTFTIGLKDPPEQGEGIALGLDRRLHPVDVKGHVPRVPAATAQTLVVDLDILARASAVDPGDIVQVWLRDDSHHLERTVTSALEEHDISVVSSDSVDTQRAVYDEAVASWGLSLALVTGVITLLITLLAMLVLAITGWRGAARDLAALRLNGVDPGKLLRASLLAQAVTVVTAVLVGTGAGILAGWLAIDQVPLFAHQPALTTLDLDPVWPAVVVAGGGTLVVLIAAGAAITRSVTKRARLERLRESS